MDPRNKFEEEALAALQRAVTRALNRKRRLGQYAVFWEDGRVIFDGPDAPAEDERRAGRERPIREIRQDLLVPGGTPHGGDSGRRDQGRRKGGNVSTFGEDLIQSLNEALAHAKGDGPAVLHPAVTPREIRKQAMLTQAQMAPLMGMSLSGYRKWEQGARRVSGPAATLLRIIEKEPEAVRRALFPPSHPQPQS